MTNRLQRMMKKTGALLLMLFLSALTSCYEDLKSDFQDLGSDDYQGYWVYDVTDATTENKLYSTNIISQDFTVSKDTYIVGCRVKMNMVGNSSSTWENVKIQVLLYEGASLVQSVSKYVYDSTRTPEYIAPSTAPVSLEDYTPFEFNLRHKATSGNTYYIRIKLVPSAGDSTTNYIALYTNTSSDFGLRVWGVSQN